MSDESAPKYPTPYRNLHHIGDILFGETTAKPFMLRGDEQLPLQRPVLTVTPEEVSLEQAQRLASFDIGLPDWLPDGFVRDDDVCVSRPPAAEAQANTSQPAQAAEWRFFPTSVHLMWRHPDGGYIGLDIQAGSLPHVYQTFSLQAQIDTLSEVQVHSRPAALIYRAEGPTPELKAVFPRATMQLIWKTPQAIYKLRAPTEYVSAAELIQVANSIPLSYQ